MSATPSTPQATSPADPKLAVVFLRMPPALKQRLQEWAKLEGKSINALAVELLTDNLDLLDDFEGVSVGT